jgi:hypothetical protein
MDAPELQDHMSRVLAGRPAPDRLHRFLESTPWKRAVSAPGKLGWRFAMPLAALLVLFIPLRQALMQVRDESVARAAVRDAIRRMVPAEAVVSQRVQISPERVYVGLVVTDAVDSAKVDKARRLLLKRTGKDVELGVRKVAGAEEILSRALKTGLELEGLRLVLEYERPPQPPSKKRVLPKEGRP